MWSENVYFIKGTAVEYEKALKKELNCEPHSSIAPNTRGRFGIYTDTDDGIPVYVIWVTEWSSLAHEIIHCTAAILRNKGMWLEDASEEAYAYLATYLDKQFRKGI